MPANAYILISIITLAVIGIIVVIKQRQALRDKDDYDQFPEETALEKEDEIEKEQRIRTLVSISLALLVAGGLAAYLIMRHQTGEACCEEAAKDSLPIAVFIPIWFAALIPILAGKKKKQALKPNQQKIIIIIFILTLLLVLGTIVFLVFERG